ncbi:hypothetical protein AGMMS50239_09220 [Bacteroidia bacterium]|nr:hypothetical protein AGMMS50239_09220 [Bacteroidia bacterium]
MSEQNNQYKSIILFIELEKSIKLLKAGLGEIQKISANNDFYEPVFMFLSNGLERLFKTMLCLNFKDKHNRFPNSDEIWKNKNGHDFSFLKNEIEKICIPVNRPFAAMDYDIIIKDTFVNSICHVLSEYGKGGRYFNIDAILGKSNNFNPKDEWEKLETQIGKEIYGEKQFDESLIIPNQLDKIYSDTNIEIIIRLEKFFRALTRQFIFGNFSKDSKTYSFQIQDFSDIDDNQLGKIQY